MPPTMHDLIAPATVNAALAELDFSNPEDAALGDAILWTVGEIAIGIMYPEAQHGKDDSETSTQCVKDSC
ncbi:MAG: hypothetical protein DRJ03_13150 [Chloroflexi bacterium]|nr:MAG: hypothetical protein DRJ03_13150 [Chloroflexota bacterium]